jgi:phosphate transport system substrate-binding protein
MNRKHLLQLVTLLTLGLSACRVPVPTIEVMPSTTPESQGMPTPETVDVSPIKAANYPRVDGSTSTYPMQVMIACVILEVSCDWTDGDYFNATRRIAPRNLLNTSDAIEVIFNLGHSGTHGAYMSLIESQADLALVAREPSADELDAALHEAVNLDVRPVALDAFVFLVHRDNPVPSLTLDQIRAIYTGEITNWSQVGGIDAEIHTYQRNPNSGSQELMEKLVMRDEQMLNSPDMILMSMMGPFSAIRDDPLGIGYSVYFYAANIFPDENVRMLAIGGVDPSTESIAADEYPLVTEVYAVMRNEALAPATALILRDWLLTADGQLAVQASGYVGRRNGSNPGGG